MQVRVALWTVLLSIVVSASSALAQTKQVAPGAAPSQPAAAQASSIGVTQPSAEGSKTSVSASASPAPAPGTEATGGTSPAAAPSPATTATGSAAPPASSAGPPGVAAAPTTAAAPGATGQAAASSSRPIDGSTFAVRLRDLEQRIDELKEQIRRSHTRLSLLSDTILSGGVGGARSEIEFQNDMSDAFRLTKLLVVLDGAVLYNKADESGALAEQEKIPIFSGSIPPGDHTVQVKVELRGHGYGVFSYLRGYSFKVENSHSFTVTEGKTLALDVIAYEKGGITTPLEQRPNVRFVETVTAGTRRAGAKASTPRKAGASASMRVGGQ